MNAIAERRACPDDHVPQPDAAVFQPAIVLPVQCLDRRNLEPARRLMLAVLEDAVATLLGYGYARGGRRRQALDEVDRWLRSDAVDWPFAFLRVCDGLGLDPHYVRTGLERLRRRHEEAPLVRRARPFRRLAGARHAIGGR